MHFVSAWHLLKQRLLRFLFNSLFRVLNNRIGFRQAPLHRHWHGLSKVCISLIELKVKTVFPLLLLLITEAMKLKIEKILIIARRLILVRSLQH